MDKGNLATQREPSVGAVETLQRILLVVGALLLGLVIVEIPATTGSFNYAWILGVDGSWWPRNRVADPELQYRGRPFAHFTGSARGGNAMLEYRIPAGMLSAYRWDVTYDGHGFRNPADFERADIAVIGDSYVEGMTVPSQHLMTTLLAGLEGSTVANLGQGGYGPQQELIALKRFALPLRPHFVIWMFYEGNDLSDVEVYDQAMRRPPGVWSDFWGRSFSRNALRRIAQMARPSGARASAVVQSGSAAAPATYYFDRQSKFSASILSPASLRDLDVAVQSIRKGQELCVAGGCRLVVAFIPTAFRVFHEYCRFPAESACRFWKPNDLPERFRRSLAAASPETPMLDLTPALSSAVGDGASPYYRDDAHWTEDGHRIAAAAIAGYLGSLKNKAVAVN